MAGADLLGGVMLNRFWGNHAAADAEAETATWKGFAGKLQTQLDQAAESELFMTLQFDANNHVLRLALEELRRANPQSPLLDKGNRDILRRQHYAQELAKHGYRFDVSTGKAVSKLG